MPVLAGTAHAYRAAILGHVGDDDDLRAAWHAPSFTEDVELDFAKTDEFLESIKKGGVERRLPNASDGQPISSRNMGDAMWHQDHATTIKARGQKESRN